MDFVGIMTIAGQTLGIIKDLRDVERDFDAASYKSQMTELYNNVSELRMALTDAREELHAKGREIEELKSRIASMQSGEQCAICEEGRLKVTASVAHPHFGMLGHQLRTVTCTNCGHKEERHYRPE
ncbi:hypothetical protein [Rhizobium sp. TRM95796]|uniref:hypothetical protein n=1 Tax=Rhizobium sp. TRM95796 TaxID=2979862 RepID=UPI0021E92A0A|nr:hypothetical protein [Rhizobium sp. TRM95796]MCV3766465.1 hypothetical protein [Rhizobium sp. TRM95796]